MEAGRNINRRLQPRHILITIGLLFVFATVGAGQKDSVAAYQYPDTLDKTPFYDENGLHPERLRADTNLYCRVLDKLAQLYFDSMYYCVDDTNTSLLKRWANIEQAFINDSVIAHKIRALPARVDLTYNSYVKRWIQVYTIKRRELARKVLGLKKNYYPLFEEVFAQYDIPQCIKHLSIVESALNPDARSWMGATGLWQFMYGTGRLYDLQVNYYVDERRDPYKSTVAAAKYLSNLHKQFNDWLLVIAAYNCGPGKVRRAIRYAGGAHDYWSIRRYLPRETRGYVPAFIAVNYLMNYYQDYNLQPTPPPADLPVLSLTNFEQVTVKERVPFETLHKYLGVSKKTLDFLNPALKRGFVPNLSVPFAVNVPCGAKVAFNKQEDSIYVDARETMQRILGDEKERMVYRVRWGDNLSTIADRYNCRIRDIMEWNGLHSTRIRAHQKLVLYISDRSSGTTAQETTSSKQASTSSAKEEEEETEATQQTSIQVSPLSNPYIFYKVNYGDTLWDIANKYPGITVEEIKRTNKISNANELKPGMILKINLAG